MERFLKLPRYPFTPAMIEHAPDESGVYGLFDGHELIYLGKTAPGASIKACLLRHQGGVNGGCTLKAGTYTWEITLAPAGRETEILARFHQGTGRGPRCQDKVA